MSQTSTWGTLLHLVLPHTCLACGGAVERSPLFGLCRQCARRLERAPHPACPLCGRGLAPACPPGFACAHCRTRKPAWDELIAGWSYEPPFDAVVAALKFRRLEYIGAQVAQVLARELGPRLAGTELVVPVPLHWRRRLQRGYNQAETIARPLARLLNKPLLHALRRRLWTPPQSRLGRGERTRNLRHAFRARRPAVVAGRTLLLVDDVVTTGSTLAAAASCLRAAGAERIIVLTAARTPERPLARG